MARPTASPKAIPGEERGGEGEEGEGRGGEGWRRGGKERKGKGRKEKKRKGKGRKRKKQKNLVDFLGKKKSNKKKDTKDTTTDSICQFNLSMLGSWGLKLEKRVRKEEGEKGKKSKEKRKTN